MLTQITKDVWIDLEDIYCVYKKENIMHVHLRPNPAEALIFSEDVEGQLKKVIHLHFKSSSPV